MYYGVQPKRKYCTSYTIMIHTMYMCIVLVVHFSGAYPTNIHVHV